MFDFEYIKDILKKNILSITSIIFGVIGISVGAGTLYYYNFVKICEEPKKLETPIEQNISVQNQSEEVVYLTVDIKGAVKKTGVYKLPKGSNIQDAINMAGGITSKASTNNINLAKKIQDEMVIYIFTKDEIKKKETVNEVACETPKCECETIIVNECPTVDKTLTDNSNNQTTDKQEKVSINNASLEQLMTLDGIGESKAKAIIEYREMNGPFKTIEDIKNVSGIGESAFEKIKDNIAV